MTLRWSQVRCLVFRAYYAFLGPDHFYWCLASLLAGWNELLQTVWALINRGKTVWPWKDARVCLWGFLFVVACLSFVCLLSLFFTSDSLLAVGKQSGSKIWTLNVDFMAKRAWKPKRIEVAGLCGVYAANGGRWLVGRSLPVIGCFAILAAEPAVQLQSASVFKLAF